MREMRSSRRTEVSFKSSSQELTDRNIGTDLTSAWKSLAQSKAALRHIENRIEATPGAGVLLESVIDLPKKKSSRTVSSKDGRQVDDFGGSSKSTSGSHQSPEKSSSRSPLRNTTHNSNVRKSNSVEFREPLASYREATPPPHPSSQLEAYSLQSVPGSLHPSSPPPSDSLPSQLVYQRDNRDKQTDRDLDSTHSSALESTEVRYLNDQPALDTLRTEESTSKAQLGMDSPDSSPHIAVTPGSVQRGESTPSTSPGSVSQRLENLRRHQPDDKLEKLKERIRRQRQHLEETAEREKLLGCLERPIMGFLESNNATKSNMPTAKIRKVAAAPPAPIYKGFNSTETKIRTPDGKVWKEEEFHNLSREIYRDLSRQFAESTKSRHQQQTDQRAGRSKESRPNKPVRKVHRAAPASDLNAKAAISPASWRKGQKLVNMVLGPVPKLPREEGHSCSTDRVNQTAARHRSDTHSESNRRSRSRSTERLHGGHQGQSKSHSTTTSIPLSAAQDKAPRGASTDLLSADIQGILDDLQLECSADEKERARKRSRGGSIGRRGGSGSRTRTPVSTWGTTVAPSSYSRVSRSASPTTHRPETANTTEKGHKKRHYDADTVRQYIARQQEERKKRLAEEKRAIKEEAEKRNQRLQELYRKQREAAKTAVPPMEAPVSPVQKRLQETYTKLLLEEMQQGEDATRTHNAIPSSQMRPMYQPSGESDKENKRQEAPQSPSSSDRSLNDPPLPMLSRNELDVGVSSLLEPDHLCPRPTTSISNSEHLLSQLLRLERTVAASDTLRPPTALSYKSQSKMSRIEAIKAKAASLSNRIESEARKLAGEGINYGTATSVDADTILIPRASDSDVWAETPACAIENNDMSLRMQRILTSTGHSSYNGTALPGADSLQFLREQKGKNDTHACFTNLHTTSADRTDPNSYIQEKRKLVNGLEKEGILDKVAQRVQYDREENQADLHDSSTGSISEGPLLSEGSFSEDQASPPPVLNSCAPRVADCQQKNFQRLSEFQREATMCPALNSPLAQHDSNRAAWEDLNKGSPLSVINIFTRGLHSHVKVNERPSERNSPTAHSLHSENVPDDAAVYEDDFVSSHSSKASGQSKTGPNSPSHFEELVRRSPCEKTGGTYSQHSSFHSSIQSPHPSTGSASGSSPLSRHSSRRRGTASDQSDATLVEEHRNSCSPPSEALSSDSKKRGSDKSSAHSQAKSVHSNDTSGHSHLRPRLASPSTSADPGSPESREPVKRGSLGTHYLNTDTLAREERGGRAQTRSTGELQYSPAVLQQRMAAELQYLDSIEESVRQLGDVERLMSVSMAQQESASLAQMLKAKQERHERELYELKIKAEREALEAQLQLEENRQRVARAHIELQESLAATQRETLEGLQDSTTKMMSQQAEAARYTVDAARHIKEMTELVRSQMPGTSAAPPVVINSSKLDHWKEQDSSYTIQRQDKADPDRFQSEVSSSRTRSDEPLSSLNSPSHSDSLRHRRLDLSGVDSSSHTSPSHVSSHHWKRTKKEPGEAKGRDGGDEEKPQRDVASSSIEEEVPPAASDSLCSEKLPCAVDDKGETTSVATEYSLKFDESMTEDEIEEHSFRSLLPSEAHRRETMEKSRHHEESEDDGTNHNSTLLSASRSINTLKSHDANIAFSGGQDSFSQFTMDMVRQYMKDEEVRLQHQSSLLRLRQKALKEKTRMELAWLEHQRKRLRDKGEDDKMPPIRKKQRGLLLKLQQEQAEIKRLQEANKSARKERQLLLKQQEEIERMRNSTLRLKQRLKCAGVEAPPETLVSEPTESEPASPSMRHPDDIRSPSPSLSISGSETSSIMQKLKKMRSHTDEKHCSPVHYFFSVFTAHHWASLSVCLPKLQPKFQLFIYKQLVRFLTKREQQLMQRRHHAEELLQWKQRLDHEEVEVRRMEKEALAVWNRKTPQDKDLEMSQSQEKDISSISSHHSHRSSEPRSDSEKDYVSEGDISSVTPESSIHTEGQQPGSPSPTQPAKVPDTPLTSVQSSPANYAQDFTSESHSPSVHQSSSLKGSHSPAASLADGSNKTKMHLRSTCRTPNQAYTQPTDPPMAAQTETISDQSDIESRIKALKEELKKRKFMAYQLKKEQKKRHKERLKAQEASLLKQLENYNHFIEKTKAELNKEPDSAPDTNSQIKESILEQSSIQPPSHRSQTNNISDSKKTHIDPSLDHNAVPQSDHNRSTSVSEDLSDEEPLTVTPTVARQDRSESTTPEQRSHQSTENHLGTSSKKEKTESGDDNILSESRSYIQEEVEVEVTSRFEDKHSQHLFKLMKEDTLDSLEKLSTSKYASSIKEEHQPPQSVSLGQDTQMKQMEISEAAEASQPPSRAVDLKTSPQPNSFNSPEPFSSTSNKEEFIKEREASPTVDGYHDDFESLVDSSPREEHHNSKLASHSSHSPTEIDSPDELVEEEIAEELSHHSGVSEPSHQSERLLDLYKQTEDLRHENSINSSHSPPISPLETHSPVIDEMPDFNIGDRVLVGSVQPGTLRFKGPTIFANGFWAGVELDKSEGSNNGTYDGVVYFKCDECHGIFAPPDKIKHLPDKFELYTDNTEDDDSFFDDLSDKGGEKTSDNQTQKQGNLKGKTEQQSHNDAGSGNNKVRDESLHKSEATLKSHINSLHHKESEHPISNGSTMDIMLELEDAAHTFLSSNVDTKHLVKDSQKEITALVEREDVDSQYPFTSVDLLQDEKREQKGRDVLDTFADRLLNSFVNDTVKQFAEIKRTKDQKIEAANQMNGNLVLDGAEEKEWMSSVEQKDGLPFFLPAEKEELSSPELCNRPESPVLGASGQEELAKRLAELELSRELLDEIGDDQDWFDEDFGLSSRREQQRLKQKEEEERFGGGLGRSAAPPKGGMVSPSGGEQHVKTPPRPELPLPLPPKLPEQPAMVVPHLATEVEKMVYAATQEIWNSCDLGKDGTLSLAHMQYPQPSQEYLGKEASGQDQEALSICSYRKAVYHLTWEILQEIYAEDPNTDQPQWAKPCRAKSSSFHRVKTPGDITKIQEFIAADVLKMYGLTKDQNQKTDWQKMLKFGRKKRDRVDHILVQELHEEEAQWVNYDEDELYVKMQLADSIFDALLKDTVNVLTLISDKKMKRDALS
ncbi:centrosome-associated protein 350 isoform X2 [Parambassis ranga]|uniref:Centrosome-associated protein 350 isoform X2 n=1 Tax=Parambassis ranga TaxID=210632 RepID=A0A6P7IEB9_9TELE|nr:centrosome-associated protein 350 isoform X2 [Parambassis ranga]